MSSIAPQSRDYVALKAPFLAQNILEQRRIRAGGFAVEAVIGAHDRIGSAFLDGGFEVGEIGFPEVGFADHGIEGMARGFQGRCGRRSVSRSGDGFEELFRIVALQVFYELETAMRPVR